MYLGRLVELAGKHQLFGEPRHPYTRMLLDAIPKMHETGRARTAVQGEVPNPLNPPPAAPSIRAARTPTRAARPNGRRCWPSRAFASPATRWRKAGSERAPRRSAGRRYVQHSSLQQCPSRAIIALAALGPQLPAA